MYAIFISIKTYVNIEKKLVELHEITVFGKKVTTIAFQDITEISIKEISVGKDDFGDVYDVFVHTSQNGYRIVCGNNDRNKLQKLISTLHSFAALT